MSFETNYINVSKIKPRWLRRLLIVAGLVPVGVLNGLFVLWAYIKAIAIGLVSVVTLTYESNDGMIRSAIDAWRKP